MDADAIMEQIESLVKVNSELANAFLFATDPVAAAAVEVGRCRLTLC